MKMKRYSNPQIANTAYFGLFGLIVYAIGRSLTTTAQPIPQRFDNPLVFLIMAYIIPFAVCWILAPGIHRLISRLDSTLQGLHNRVYQWLQFIAYLSAYLLVCVPVKQVNGDISSNLIGHALQTSIGSNPSTISEITTYLIIIYYAAATATIVQATTAQKILQLIAPTLILGHHLSGSDSTVNINIISTLVIGELYLLWKTLQQAFANYGQNSVKNSVINTAQGNTTSNTQNGQLTLHIAMAIVTVLILAIGMTEILDQQPLTKATQFLTQLEVNPASEHINNIKRLIAESPIFEKTNLSVSLFSYLQNSYVVAMQHLGTITALIIPSLIITLLLDAISKIATELTQPFVVTLLSAIGITLILRTGVNCLANLGLSPYYANGMPMVDYNLLMWLAMLLILPFSLIEPRKGKDTIK